MPCKESRTVRLYVQFPNEASLEEKKKGSMLKLRGCIHTRYNLTTKRNTHKNIKSCYE